MLCTTLGLAAASLSAGQALAASWSSTMQVSATVVSSCTLAVMPNAAASGILSRCTRGERPSVSLTETPNPPAPAIRQVSRGAMEFLVVAY
ncbi:MAG: hypothetical protein ACREFO_13135 [Acetobacteraceae bacterium]